MDEMMTVFECRFEIQTVNGTRTQIITAPRFMLEQKTLSLLKDASYSTKPVRVKISRKEAFWNQFDNKWSEREYFIEFTNNAYEQRSC